MRGAKSIGGATGDVAITVSGWIESETYGIYMYRTATAVSAEFDTAVTRTGAKTLKLSTTDTTGRVGATFGYNTIPPGTLTISVLRKYGIPVKPATEYTLSCYAKTVNVVVNGVFIPTYYFTAAGARSIGAISNKLSAGDHDWTLITVTFTTGASDVWLVFNLYNFAPGNVSDAWWDVNSMTLVETAATRTLASARNPVV